MRKKKKNQIQITGNLKRNMITCFEQLLFIAILIAFSSGGNV